MTGHQVIPPPPRLVFGNYLPAHFHPFGIWTVAFFTFLFPPVSVLFLGLDQWRTRERSKHLCMVKHLSMALFYPSERCFDFARNMCVSELQNLDDNEIRVLLPSLVRIVQRPSLDESDHWKEALKEINKLLCRLEDVNYIIRLLCIDFNILRYE